MSFENCNFPVGLPPSKNSPEIIFFIFAPLPHLFSLFQQLNMNLLQHWNKIDFFLLFWEIKSCNSFDGSFCFTGKLIPPSTPLNLIADTRKIFIPSKPEALCATRRWEGTTISFNIICFKICYVHGKTYSSISWKVHFFLLPFTPLSGPPSQQWLYNITDFAINKSWGNGRN